MADLTITAASVVSGSDATVVRSNNAGEAVTAGQSVYLKTSDSKWYKAQCDGTAEESGVGTQIGVALHAASANQPLAVQTGGAVTIGATVVATTEYVVSATAGGIAPAADLVSTNRYTRLGYASSTTVLKLGPLASDVQKA